MSREVVVLREGPPKKRGALVDAITGVLGVLLLVMAGVLGEVLPEEDFIPDQYLVTFDLDQNGTVAQLPQPDGSTGQSVSRFYMEDGQVADFPFTMTDNNIVRLSLEVFLENDDLPSSLQDQFKFELIAPDGNSVGEPFFLRTGTPSPKEIDTSDPTTINPSVSQYQTAPVRSSTSWTLNQAPDPQLLSGKDGKQIDRETALLWAFQNHTIETAGEYILRVTLTETGDCPQASPSQEGANRAADCQRFAAEGDEDPGNAVTINKVTAFYYVIDSPPS